MAGGKSHHKDSPERCSIFRAGWLLSTETGVIPLVTPNTFNTFSSAKHTLALQFIYHENTIYGKKKKKKSKMLSYKEMPLTSSQGLLQA